ncbi:hypothetical protein SAMN05216321_101137 [Cupriavidus sp. OV038]|jgi:hypothetical protein|uniref:hypothetical protein n=1 Tax=unclassified Cupriavidus TaxID=2640874 RepID=UPI0008F21215|nr:MULTISPECIES: hypothetical protein [unclassified Cupriavidus]SFB68854.1 hypothetical protein SAMN05216321_101137 [Cupriavidus sp. OV038]SFO58240.1 hypothetical protein SAMN05216322_101137 [Cupriavidus sp. OV096]
MNDIQAADLIAADLRAGAVEPYCPPDQALQYLGDIFKAGNVGYLVAESPSQHLRRSHELMGVRAHAIFDEIIGRNVQRVADEETKASAHARSDARELVTERGPA